jgi:ubiquinone/menaquinone biosynthesis C-methylase UbiE
MFGPLRHLVLIASAAALLAPAGASGQLASRPAAEWIKMLDSPERIAGLQIDEILSKLPLKSGDVVADLGAGTAAFSLPLARAVGGGGRVYAVEVEQGLVDYMRDKAEAQKVTNLTPVLGRFTDPALPTRDVDLAFFHDALHHIADRTGYLAALVTYLKPTARVAIVEMDPVTGPHRNDPTLQITKDQLNTWMATLGYEPQQTVDISGTKWLAVYARR